MSIIFKLGLSIIDNPQGNIFGSYVNGLEIHQVVALANAMWLAPNAHTGKVDPHRPKAEVTYITK